MPLPIDEWYWISLPYATYGVLVQNAVIVAAAPIARWAVGKDWDFFVSWVSGKGGEIQAL